MRLAILVSLILAQSAFAAAATDPKNEPMPTPLMRTVEPFVAKVGVIVTVTGDNLNQKTVGEVYLTANNENFQADVISQSAKELKFRVPAAKPGVYKILVLMKSFDPVLIEEPVKIKVVE